MTSVTESSPAALSPTRLPNANYRIAQNGNEQNGTHLLFPHFGKFIKKGKVLREMFTVGFNTMFHNRQQGFHKASYTRTATDIFHRAIHVVRTETTCQRASLSAYSGYWCLNNLRPSWSRRHPSWGGSCTHSTGANSAALATQNWQLLQDGGSHFLTVWFNRMSKQPLQHRAQQIILFSPGKDRK